MLYLFMASMLFIVVMAIRTSYVGNIFYRYVKEHHPELSKDFTQYRPFVSAHPYHKKYDIYDPEFLLLKKRARNAMRWLCLSILLPVLIMIIFLIQCLICGI